MTFSFVELGGENSTGKHSVVEMSG